MEFEIQPNYTVEDFAAFWHGFREKQPGRKGARQPSGREMRRYGWLLLLLGGFVTLMYWPNPLNLQLPLTMAWPGPFFLAVGAMIVIQRRPGRAESLQPYWAQRAWKKWSGQNPELRWSYRFTPEGVELHNRTSDHRYDYSAVRQAWEDEGHFYFTLDERVWHILNKSQFTKGDPARFAAFLAEQTGRPVDWVNGEKEPV